MGSIHNFRPYIPLIHYYYKKKIVGPVTQYILILHKIIIENDHCQKSTVETPPTPPGFYVPVYASSSCCRRVQTLCTNLQKQVPVCKLDAAVNPAC